MFFCVHFLLETFTDRTPARSRTAPRPHTVSTHEEEGVDGSDANILNVCRAEGEVGLLCAVKAGHCFGLTKGSICVVSL